MGGRLLIPFAADHPRVRAIVLYYPSVRDEPEMSHRPRHAFKLAPRLECASLVFCGGKDYIATTAIQAPLWQRFIANGGLVEWHSFSDANHGFRHPDSDGFQPHDADLLWPLVTNLRGPVGSFRRIQSRHLRPLVSETPAVRFDRPNSLQDHSRVERATRATRL